MLKLTSFVPAAVGRQSHFRLQNNFICQSVESNVDEFDDTITLKCRIIVQLSIYSLSDRRA